MNLEDEKWFFIRFKEWVNNYEPSVEKVNLFFTHLKTWVKKHKYAVVILTTLWIIVTIIHFFGYWEALGLLFLKFGLGVKVAGVKTFAKAVAKAGGKKAIAAATAGMLVKRHIIDLSSKYFAEHSVARYKTNLIKVFKIKLKEVNDSSVVKKIRALGILLLSIPGFYFFWTKVLGVFIQKLVYALILPISAFIWNIILTSINVFSFLLQVLMLNIALDALAKYTWGKKILYFIDWFVNLIGQLFMTINGFLRIFCIETEGYLLIYKYRINIKWVMAIVTYYFPLRLLKYCIAPKKWLIKNSSRFNNWLESLLDKGLNSIVKIENKRNRYINIIESISEKRLIYAQKKLDKKVSFWKYAKIMFSKKVLKRIDWRDLRELRKQKQNDRLVKTLIYKRKESLTKKEKRTTLLLPYMVIKMRRKSILKEKKNRGKN